jgi:hypothetical protein
MQRQLDKHGQQKIHVQGLQRRLDKQGNVAHLAEPSPLLLGALTPDVTIFLSDVETDPWTDEQLRGTVSRCRRLIVTRGAKGVSSYEHNQDETHVPARKIKAIDTNGAGDTFATAYMLSISRGRSVRSSLVTATWMASRVCLQAQECKPACCAEAVQEDMHDDDEPLPQKLQPQLFMDALPRPEDDPTASAYV